jgi:hypothetical protein
MTLEVVPRQLLGGRICARELTHSLRQKRTVHPADEPEQRG